MARISEDVEKHVINLYAGGSNIPSISRKLCIGKSTCSRVLDRNGIKTTKSFARKKFKDIIKEYKDGMSINKIIQKYKCCYRTCVKILKENGINIRNCAEATAMEHRLLENEKEIIKTLYLEGYSIRKISRETKHMRSTCKNVLKESNIELREWDNRTYKVDDFYFNYIDCERKAYWVGFILADGCLVSNENTLALGLASKDKCHLQKFKNNLNAENPIHDRTTKSGFFGKSSEFSEIRISSKQVKKDLLKIGLTERKTFKAKPIKLNDDLVKHFWRGCVDGDGWICKYDDRNIIGLCGTYKIVDGFADFLSESLGINRLYPKKHGSIFKIVYYGKGNPQKIVKFLYEGSEIYLDRKMQIANKIIRG